jgi:hypothetical protein
LNLGFSSNTFKAVRILLYFFSLYIHINFYIS